MAERKYFLAHGESETKVRAFFERRVAAIKEGNDLAVSLGGLCAVFSHCVGGVIFADKAPDGWTMKGRTSKGEKYFMPLRKSKAGKDLASRLTSIRIPEARDLHSQFSSDGGHIDGGGMGFAIHYISAEIAKGKAIISVPAGLDFTPPESTPLKMSEYWAIKEGEAA